MTNLNDYAPAIREIMAKNGVPVDINKKERRDSPEYPQDWVSVYGWADTVAIRHFNGRADQCSWVVPEGVKMTEVAYSEFMDTFTDNEVTVGLNVYGGEEGEDTEIHCACGKYRGATLRYIGSFGEMIANIMNAKAYTGITL